MDAAFDQLPLRFHFNGEFINDGKNVHYHGGSEAMSYIDRDKMSLPEITGHLHDHCEVKEGTLLHWLFPRKDLSSGLRVLFDDRTCQTMSDCIVEGGVAEVYVRMPGRPKTERRREASEPRKPSKITKVGTVIRCRKCHGVGHNKTTCDKRNSQPTSATDGSNSVAAANLPIVSATQQSQSTTRKRKAPSTATQTSLQIPGMSGSSSKQPNQRKQKRLTTTTANAKVTTCARGSADISLHAHVPVSRASSSVTINIRSGTASAQASAHEPANSKNAPAKRPIHTTYVASSMAE